MLFFILIAYAFAIALKGVNEKNRSSYVEYAPSLMTSLGLFGTFLGIYIGLQEFDPKNIDGSIEQILNGLKTAFITSIVGMAFAIAFKVLQTRKLDKESTDSSKSDQLPEEVTPKDIHRVLLKQYDAMALMAKGIGGGDERSMVGQLQLLRTDVIDMRSGINQRQEAFEVRLWSQLNEFAEMMSRSATQQVIEALQQVILDFNNKLSEQFGENFKRLDQSVQKLVEWQANYMQQLTHMTALYEQGVTSIQATRVAVEGIRTETSRIPQDMTALSDVLSVNQHQIGELNRHLDAFVSMRDKAVLAVPQIQEKLEQVGEQLRDGAEQVNQILIKGSDVFEQSVQRTGEVLNTTANSVAQQSENISTELRNALELLGLNTERIRTGVTGAVSSAMESVEEAVNRTLQAHNQSTTNLIQTMTQATDRSLGGVERQIQEAVNKTNDAVNAQLRQLDEALSKQLNAALQELGSALSTIARHLVDSYNRDRSSGSGPSF
ncbi:MAG: MotA/TolQ/ExbB proton channel family protein [Aquabacterium sp.]